MNNEDIKLSTSLDVIETEKTCTTSRRLINSNSMDMRWKKWQYVFIGK